MTERNMEMDGEEEREPPLLLKSLLCLVAALEGADNLLIPVTMFALQQKVGIEFTDLIYLGGVQAICANLAGPMWGMLADNGKLSRKTILMIGSLGQGVVTALLAFVTSVKVMAFLRGLNGIMLASLRPISNGVVADSTSDARRGKIFGQIQAALTVGMLFTSLVATPIANQTLFVDTPLEFDGWRFAYLFIGSLSIIVCALLKFYFKDPRSPVERVRSGGCSTAIAEIRSLIRFFKIPTFSIMILQGIFGTIPWAVLGMMTLFFQLSGRTDAEATLLQTEQLIVGIFGNILGGWVADHLARRLGYHGRPLNAQITVAVGMPLIYMMFVGIPPGEGELAAYVVLIFCWSLFGCWAQSGTNFPILCEIVPAEARCRILAWECCLENTIANALAPPLVAIVSDRLGYSFGQGSDDDISKLESARALGQAMAIITIVPGLVCFLAYAFLHCTYANDVKRLKSEQAAWSSDDELPDDDGDSTEAELTIAGELTS